MGWDFAFGLGLAGEGGGGAGQGRGVNAKRSTLAREIETMRRTKRGGKKNYVVRFPTIRKEALTRRCPKSPMLASSVQLCPRIQPTPLSLPRSLTRRIGAAVRVGRCAFSSEGVYRQGRRECRKEINEWRSRDVVTRPSFFLFFVVRDSSTRSVGVLNRSTRAFCIVVE